MKLRILDDIDDDETESEKKLKERIKVYEKAKSQALGMRKNGHKFLQADEAIAKVFTKVQYDNGILKSPETFVYTEYKTLEGIAVSSS